MTGNTKVWRAPLAGLAAVAMLATMGVAASTANAATVTDYGNLEVAGKSFSQQALQGESYADVLGYYSRSGDYSTILSTPTTLGANQGFAGWTADGQNVVDLYNGQVQAGATTTLKPLTVSTTGYGQGKSDVIEVKYASSLTGLSLTAGSEFYVKKGQDIPAGLLPKDKPGDGKLVTRYKAVVSNGTETKTYDNQTLAQVAALTEGNPLAGANSIEVSEANTLTGDDVATLTLDYNTYSSKGYVRGAQADANVTDLKYKVDVEAGTNVTVPTWFGYPNATTTTVSAWKPANAVNNDNTTYAAGQKFQLNTDFDLVPAKSGVTSGYTVTFVADGKVLKDDQIVPENAEGDARFAVAPTAPSKDGYAFAGWKIQGVTAGPQWDKLFVDESKPLASGEAHLSDYVIKANTTFEAQWNSRVTNVVVTFKDQDYSGKNADQQVKVDVPSLFTADQAPTFKRSGYTFEGWYKSEADAKTRTNEYKFNEWFTDTTVNFTLYAGWKQADEDTAKAALTYILPEKYVDAYNKGTGSTLTGNDGSDFSNFSDYEAAYEPLLEKYLTEVYNKPNTGVKAQAAGEVVDGLNAALAKLRFKKDLDHVAEKVNRLRTNDGKYHLWTTDEREVRHLTSTTHTNGAGGWVLEDSNAFNTLKGSYDLSGKTGATDAGKYVDAPEGVNAVVKVLYRLNSDVTKEHMYTDSKTEYDALGKVGWTQEGVGFLVPANGETPVYRVYIPSLQQHFWTKSLQEYNALISKPDWYTAEKVAFVAL